MPGTPQDYKDINDYISKNYQELKNIVSNITNGHQLTDELLHYTIEILLTYNEDKMAEIVKKGHTKFFFISIVLNQWKSTTSPFYKTYRCNKRIEYTDEPIDIIAEESEYDKEIDIKIDFIQQEMDNQHWYTQQVIKLKMEHSYQQIKDITGIPRSSLYSTFNKFRKETIKKYDDTRDI